MLASLGCVRGMHWVDGNNSGENGVLSDAMSEPVVLVRCCLSCSELRAGLETRKVLGIAEAAGAAPGSWT